MCWWRGLSGLFALLGLLIAAPALAEPGIQLPKGEEVADWSGALQLAGLSAQDEDAPLRLERVEDAWRIVAVAADGQERRVVVDPPVTDADRESVAFLARGLLREVLRTQAAPQPTSSGAERQLPADRPSGVAEDVPEPPVKGMTDEPASGAGGRVIRVEGLRMQGTDAPDAPIAVPDTAVEVYVTDLPRWRQEGRKVLAAPPLWLRIGAATRPGVAGSTHIMAGTELLRRGRLRLDLELGGVLGRDLRLDLPRRLGHFDVEGSATVAVLGRASIGGGLGTSYRMYRQQGVLVDQHLVPTAQLRMDVPLFSSRKIALVARVQGKVDLARTDLVLPDGQRAVLSPFELQPALVLRYHGALDLLSDYRRRP